jgi:hypothetical protein
MALEPAVAFERERELHMQREEKDPRPEIHAATPQSLSSHLPLCVVIHAYYINNAYKTRTRLSGASGRGCDSGCIFMSSAKCFKQKVFDVCACRVRGEMQAQCRKNGHIWRSGCTFILRRTYKCKLYMGFVNCSGFF